MLIVKPKICDCCKQEVKKLPYQLIWTKKDEWCKSCGQNKTEEIYFDFCSAQCLAKHSNKLISHKHDWELGAWGGGAQIENGKILKVHAWCSICKAQQWMAPTPVLKKKYQAYFGGAKEFAKAMRRRD